MRTIFTVFALAVSIQLIAQETKKETIRKLHYTETYYVLKDDNGIKHGEYVKKYGIWTVSGKFHQGKRVGVWEYVGKNAQLELKIDFDTDSVLLNKPSNLISKVLVADGDSFREVVLDQNPVFLGGTGNIHYYLLDLEYPLEARRMGVEGTVTISATITKDGKIIDEKILLGSDFILNKEAMRTIQRMPDDWMPAKLNGEAVESLVIIPIVFKLN